MVVWWAYSKYVKYSKGACTDLGLGTFRVCVCMWFETCTDYQVGDRPNKPWPTNPTLLQDRVDPSSSPSKVYTSRRCHATTTTIVRSLADLVLRGPPPPHPPSEDYLQLQSIHTMAPNQQNTLILFDLASRDGNKCWSYNPWKTRFVLAYKGLDYTTEFLDYPDIEKRLSPHITAQNYTIPTIQYTDGRYIMDSRAIAETIEKDHPSPPLYLDSPYLANLERLLGPLTPTLRPHFIPKVVRTLLRDPSLDYFISTREAAIGMTLDEFEAKEGQDFTKAEPHLQPITSLLKENAEGPFFMGKTKSYADFLWASILIFFRRIDATGGEFEGLLQATGDASAHRALLEALEPLFKRDDH